MLDVNLLAKEISELFGGNALSSPKVIFLTFLFIWLFKFLMNHNDNLLNLRDQEIKTTMKSCSEILKNAELTISNKISKEEFIAIVNEQLALMSPKTFSLFTELLEKGESDIEKFKSTALQELTTLKTHNHFSGKYFNLIIYFYDIIVLIAKPLLQTAIIMLITFLTINTILEDNNLTLFLFLTIYIFGEVILLSILLDLSIKFTHLTFNILIFSIPFIIFQVSNSTSLTIIFIIICSVGNIFIQKKLYKP
ncbi:hypothetical protein C6X95_06625 [Bacillus pumilus]|uniref:hypothetical protein n=1 Tax=Bacillus pumilus TaxID=1408 RepID=UPI000D02495B|nr:hypothetical protein [Bacillus pumilus]PRS14647.1 hypothetical protein C6X95_06625 [Bacillus pumilus]